MNLLLTGASGFMGRNVILAAPSDWNITAVYRNDRAFPEFVADKPNVRAVRCDLSDTTEISSFFANYGREWESCLYLAARVDIPWSTREPKLDLLENVVPLLNCLEHLRADKFVYFSSGAVYSGLNGEVRPGDHFTATLPYAVSKLACENYVQFFAERRRSIENFLTVRFFGAYGPHEAPHKIYTRLIRAFAIERRNTYTIYGDGSNLIDAMYVDDAVDAVFRILRSTSHWNQTVNLCAGQTRTIETLVREVADVFGITDLSIAKDGVAHESNRFWGSTSEMEKDFGFHAGIPLVDGIRRFSQCFAIQ
jgi:nucleoside-diphosphate-sugar epimerase